MRAARGTGDLPLHTVSASVGYAQKMLALGQEATLRAAGLAAAESAQAREAETKILMAEQKDRGGGIRYRGLRKGTRSCSLRRMAKTPRTSQPQRNRFMGDLEVWSRLWLF
jgi:hypothetical protein